MLLALPAKIAQASEDEVICPQPYGGGVVCGVKTHEPVATGIGDNIPLIGASFILASGVLFLLSKKLKKTST